MKAGWVGPWALIAVLAGCAPAPAPKAAPDPGAFQALMTRGVDQLSQRDYPAAAQTFRDALALSPGSAVAHNDLGVACLRQGAWPSAEAEFRKAATLEPGSATFNNNLAASCYLLRQYAQAKEAYLAALAADPGFAAANYGLCNLLLATGAPEEGCRYLAKGLELDPDFLERQGDLLVGRQGSLIHKAPTLLDYTRTLAGAGNVEGTLALLAMAEKTGFKDWADLKNLPELAKLKEDPRVQAVLQRH